MSAKQLIVSSNEGTAIHPLPDRSRQVIGRGRHCDIRLNAAGVARRHAELNLAGETAWIRVLGSRQRLVVNGERLREAGPLGVGDCIELGDASIRVEASSQTSAPDPASPADAPAASHHAPLPAPVASPEPAPMPSPAPPPAVSEAPAIGAELAREFQEAISQRLDLYRRDVLETLSTDRLREEAKAAAWSLLEEGVLQLPAEVPREEAVRTVVAETVGLGPIERLMDDAAVSEIMVNGPAQIYVERGGRLELTGLRFSSAASLSGILERIVSPLGRRLDEGSPLVDARLPDGSRVNAIIPPLALNGAALTIRRFPEHHLSLDDLVGYGALSEEMARFLRVCIEQRRNILISGGTGTGKTTVLNALSAHIAEGERIITIEDSAELRLQQSHVVALESRPANIEGSGAIPIRELVRNALRMRPDRILVGECRGGEALDMLQAMNTGHDGSLTTAHANSPRDAVARLEVMTLMAGFELPVRAIREQISAALDIVVQLTRFGDGSRRITAITEVDGMEGDRILLNDLFVFQAGGHRPTGQVPAFFERMRAAGTDVDLGPFQPHAGTGSHEPELQAGPL